MAGGLAVKGCEIAGRFSNLRAFVQAALGCHPAEYRIAPSPCYLSFPRLLKILVSGSAGGLLVRATRRFLPDFVLEQRQNGPELGLESSAFGASVLRLELNLQYFQN